MLLIDVNKLYIYPFRRQFVKILEKSTWRQIDKKNQKNKSTP